MTRGRKAQVALAVLALSVTGAHATAPEGLTKAAAQAVCGHAATVRKAWRHAEEVRNKAATKLAGVAGATGKVSLFCGQLSQHEAQHSLNDTQLGVDVVALKTAHKNAANAIARLSQALGQASSAASAYGQLFAEMKAWIKTMGSVVDKNSGGTYKSCLDMGTGSGDGTGAGNAWGSDEFGDTAIVKAMPPECAALFAEPKGSTDSTATDKLSEKSTDEVVASAGANEVGVVNAGSDNTCPLIAAAASSKYGLAIKTTGGQNTVTLGGIMQVKFSSNTNGHLKAMWTQQLGDTKKTAAQHAADVKAAAETGDGATAVCTQATTRLLCKAAGELDKQIASAQQVVDKHVQDAKDLAREESEESTATPQNAPPHRQTQENKRGTEQAQTALEHATSKGQSTHNADNAPTIELTGTAAAALLCMTLAAGAQRH
ncbi:hypothetical protein, conserved in T. vivax [Trypanosoma vivax Y486]|uniref:Trypanosome variant surface glycoprotein A-type N-terminal domain-containing protein n=1 Tax=Trypanosoma vivax (strain Y486) TaxID=1055687 RepID=F9WQW8_TRYVY|nr:hypothetical protein, conserved in T. vivax [Trypanosoma vivax Y486]|eukprot:CCD19950.1 hypothetical protein, conserved in T. vivax [Trypanosoma vivax Y486]